LILALWTIPALALTTSFYLTAEGDRSQVPWVRFFLNQLTLWIPWALLTPLVGRLGRRFTFARGRWAKSLAVHLACGLGVSFAFFVYVVGQEVVMGLDLARVGRGVLLATFVRIALVHTTIYWIVLLVHRALAYHQRNREREASLTRARLEALKAQVHPHFLFNTLHAISSLMDEDVPAARRMVSRLSTLLRESLSSSGRQEVSLGEELELVKLYLDIEQQRFEDRLRVSYRVEPELEEALVPHLLLQPLAENAIRHGIARESRAGQLEVGAESVDGRLRLTVTDDGPGLNGRPPSEGIGLGTTRTRLHELYGDEATLELENVEPRGCRALVELPIRWR
jgi:sensor histidine kinase YesM